MHRAHGPQLAALCILEGLQGRDGRSEAALPVRPGTEARQALEALGERWGSQYPQISGSRQSRWGNLITTFEYPPVIWKVIYTTNAIESLNSVIRKATRRSKLFPGDDSALKVSFLAIQQASKK